MQLESREQRDFLDDQYFSPGSNNAEGEFKLLRKPCEVTISYIEKSVIEADVVLHDPTREEFYEVEFFQLKFSDGDWKLED